MMYCQKSGILENKKSKSGTYGIGYFPEYVFLFLNGGEESA